jgi:molybdopterin/thiamine biosynthesis adenylyltransferase
MGSAENTDALRQAFRRAGLREDMNGDQARAVAAETGVPLRAVEAAALAEGIVPQRYARNIGTLGSDGQRTLLESCVVVVGLGGLGGHVVESLARLGVGRIVAVDSDAFDETNLNRQLIATTDNLGESKAEQARLRVARVNPAVQFVAHAARFESLGEELFRRCDLVLDCLDTMPARRTLAGRCAAAGAALVHGAIAGWCGQVGLCPPDSNMLERLFDGKGDHGAEAELGTPPFTAAVAANLMAAWAVRALLGGPTQPKLVFFDLHEGDWETVQL